MLRFAHSTRFALQRSARPLVARRSYCESPIHKRIKETVEKDPLVLFMKGVPHAPNCGYSAGVVQMLQKNGQTPISKLIYLNFTGVNNFASYNVLEDHELRQGIKEYSDWPTIPQLYINGEFVGGYDIVKSMDEKGELQEQLKSATNDKEN